MSKIVVTPLGTISPYTKGNMNCPGFLILYKFHESFPLPEMLSKVPL